MANLAESLESDIESVQQGSGSFSLIGYHFIYLGVGYDGSYFLKSAQVLQAFLSLKKSRYKALMC